MAATQIRAQAPVCPMAATQGGPSPEGDAAAASRRFDVRCPSVTVPAVHDWPTNGHLIADVASLHFEPDDAVFDMTYGRGTWWTQYQPTTLVTNDIVPGRADHAFDFREVWAAFGNDWVDVVAYDPPYKLSGTPALGDFDDRYGIDVPARWQDRMQLIIDGLDSAFRFRPRLVLAKCQDQVCSGQVRWQTIELTNHATAQGWRLVDRFDMTGTSRPQPAGRRQVHARGRPSTLLVFGH